MSDYVIIYIPGCPRAARYRDSVIEARRVSQRWREWKEEKCIRRQTQRVRSVER